MPFISGGGGGGGAVALVLDQTLGAPAATLDFTGISAGFTALTLRAQLRSDQAANNNALVTFNGDAGANYYWTSLQGVGAVASSASNRIQTSLPAQCPGTNADTNVFSFLIAEFYNYSSGRLKVVEATVNLFDNVASSNTYQQTRWSWMWSGTAAISRITLTAPAAGNFIAASRATLWGTV